MAQKPTKIKYIRVKDAETGALSDLIPISVDYDSVTDVPIVSEADINEMLTLENNK